MRLRAGGGVNAAASNGAVIFAVCGGYQLIGTVFGGAQGEPVELYYLPDDPEQQRNLAAAQPAKVEALPAECFGVHLQFPGTSGKIRDQAAIIEAAHAAGALVTVAADLLALDEAGVADLARTAVRVSYAPDDVKDRILGEIDAAAIDEIASRKVQQRGIEPPRGHHATDILIGRDLVDDDALGPFEAASSGMTDFWRSLHPEFHIARRDTECMLQHTARP